jgi:hypothetical protein
VQALLDHLAHDIFARAFAGDRDVIEAIGRFDGELRCVDGDLLFTLPDLFRFVLIDIERRGPLPSAERDYRAFLRALYRSDMNATLRRIGAVVIVDRGDKHHALRRYRLTRCPA